VNVEAVAIYGLVWFVISTSYPRRGQPASARGPATPGWAHIAVLRSPAAPAQAPVRSWYCGIYTASRSMSRSFLVLCMLIVSCPSSLNSFQQGFSARGL